MNTVNWVVINIHIPTYIYTHSHVHTRTHIHTAKNKRVQRNMSRDRKKGVV